MLKKLYLWLREKVAGEELRELAELKKRLGEARSYMREDPRVVDTVDWISGKNKSDIRGFRDHYRFKYTAIARSLPNLKYSREELIKSQPKYYRTRDTSELTSGSPSLTINDELGSSNVVPFPRD
ncbi:hypothetical protein [Photobacterium phage PDCC-1]|uniref:Uncharacterized protein n=2 Tax=Aphroditevirus TaxID=2560092 RepID=A0A6B9J2D4_9CAUD|nr:hypothetical protein HWC03_gp109 [Vibrio phage 2 TSL-2019]YP_009853459.1 hypothetical protein HWC77_gp107 [Photobacterium phage PDCC-1]QAU04264.1 hypothetical protein [Vibrio phage 2 TSL-2019]QGZ14470.1 hypothetical protein [Photobacterium phage PDCC-1]